MKSHTLGYKPGENGNRFENILQTQKVKNLKALIHDKNTVLFNCGLSNIKIMYYTGFMAYELIPSEKDCQIVKDKGYKIAVLRNKILPDYIEKNKNILKINF